MKEIMSRAIYKKDIQTIRTVIFILFGFLFFIITTNVSAATFCYEYSPQGLSNVFEDCKFSDKSACATEEAARKADTAWKIKKTCYEKIIGGSTTPPPGGSTDG